MITAKVQKLKEYRRQIRESRCPVLENISTYEHMNMTFPSIKLMVLKKKSQLLILSDTIRVSDLWITLKKGIAF